MGRPTSQASRDRPLSSDGLEVVAVELNPFSSPQLQHDTDYKDHPSPLYRDPSPEDHKAPIPVWPSESKGGRKSQEGLQAYEQEGPAVEAYRDMRDGDTREKKICGLRRRVFFIVLAACLLILAMGIGIGVGVGMRHSNSSDDGDSSATGGTATRTTASGATSNPTVTTSAPTSTSSDYSGQSCSSYEDCGSGDYHCIDKVCSLTSVSIPTTTAAADSCTWEGHCIGATCADENDCSDSLFCVDSVCIDG